MHRKHLNRRKNYIKEDADGMGPGLAVSGMGDVVSSQPSALPGQTTDPGFSDNGGVVGSGDISVPYARKNANGDFIYQKIPAPTVFKKKRKKKMYDKDTIKSLYSQKQDYTNGQGDTRVLNYDDFVKSQMNIINKN